MIDDIGLLDSNLLVYAFDISEKKKHMIAKEMLNKCFMENAKFAVSTQNLSEFFVIVTKKITSPIPPMEAAEIVKNIIKFNGFIKIEPNKECIETAMDLAIKTNTSYWDALIAATMLQNNIFTIYTENLKDFSKIKNIQIKNPFD